MMEQAKRSLWVWCAMSERDRWNQLRLVGWIFAWAAAWVLASAGIGRGWVPAALQRSRSRYCMSFSAAR